MIAEGIALYLADHGLVTYDPDGIEGDCFLFNRPDSPAALVTITPFGGDAPVVEWAWDDPAVQVWVRGEPGAHSATYSRAYSIYSRLHGLRSLALPDGTWLMKASCTSSGPVYVGADAKRRPEYVLNFDLATLAPTANRKE